MPPQEQRTPYSCQAFCVSSSGYKGYPITATLHVSHVSAGQQSRSGGEKQQSTCATARRPLAGSPRYKCVFRLLCLRLPRWWRLTYLLVVSSRTQALVRAHLSKRTVAKLSKNRKERRISDARLWTETWSEDAQMWFYHNATTGTWKGRAVLL